MHIRHLECLSMTWPLQVAGELEHAAENAPETLLPMVLQLLASLLEYDRLALQEGLPGALPHTQLFDRCPAQSLAKLHLCKERMRCQCLQEGLA